MIWALQLFIYLLGCKYMTVGVGGGETGVSVGSQNRCWSIHSSMYICYILIGCPSNSPTLCINIPTNHSQIILPNLLQFYFF